MKLDKYHVFNLEKQNYVIDIEEMKTFKVEEKDVNNFINVKQEINFKKNHIKQNYNKTIALWVLLTEQCNQKCTYCFVNEQPIRMSESIAYKIIDWVFSNYLEFHLVFFGGEPLLEFELMKNMVNYIEKNYNNYKISYTLISNCSLINDEIIKFIKDKNIKIQISFDGCENIQNEHRPLKNNKESFKNTFPKIKKIIEDKDIDCWLHSVTTDNNPIEVKNFFQQEFKNIRMSTRSCNYFDNKISVDHQIQEAIEEASLLINSIKERNLYKILMIKNRSELDTAIKALTRNTKSFSPCGAGQGLYGVDALGNFYLCHRFISEKKFFINNISNMNQAIMPNPSFNPSILTIEKCQNCFARYYCAGSCKHLFLNGIETPNLCKVKQMELILASYIINNLTEEDIKEYFAI